MTNPAEFVRALPLGQIAPSPFNPRRATDDEHLAELADSIRTHGVLQPIVVRPLTGAHDDKQYQIIAGHRRVLAAQDAGLTEVPAIVRTMTDAELRAAHLVENLQRENLAALEEAEGYARLRDQDGLTAVEIAAQVGKKPGVVYNRLKLLELCDEARTALATGIIGAEVGQLIARIPLARLQGKALAKATERNWRGETKSYREIRDLLVEEFTLRLSEAIFPRDDATLLPDAGACTTCVKRSGGDPHLFSDLLQKDTSRHGMHSAAKHGDQLCTDPDCFARKKAAQLARDAAKLVAKGKEVITGAAARKALSAPDWQGRVAIKGAEFVPLKEVKDQLKKAKSDTKPAPVVLQDPRSGKTVQAVRREDLKAAGIMVEPPTREQDRRAVERAREARALQQREAAAAAEQLRRRQILDAVRDKIRTSARSAFDLRLVARVAYAGVDYGGYQVLAELWGEKSRNAMDQRLDKLSLTELTLFVIDCALVNAVRISEFDLGRRTDDRGDPLFAAAQHYGVDIARFGAAPSEEKTSRKRGKQAGGEPVIDDAGDAAIEPGDLELAAGEDGE